MAIGSANWCLTDLGGRRTTEWMRTSRPLWEGSVRITDELRSASPTDARTTMWRPGAGNCPNSGSHRSDPPAGERCRHVQFSGRRSSRRSRNVRHARSTRLERAPLARPRRRRLSPPRSGPKLAAERVRWRCRKLATARNAVACRSLARPTRRLGPVAVHVGVAHGRGSGHSLRKPSLTAAVAVLAC